MDSVCGRIGHNAQLLGQGSAATLSIMQLATLSSVRTMTSEEPREHHNTRLREQHKPRHGRRHTERGSTAAEAESLASCHLHVRAAYAQTILSEFSGGASAVLTLAVEGLGVFLIASPVAGGAVQLARKST